MVQRKFKVQQVSRIITAAGRVLNGPHHPCLHCIIEPSRLATHLLYTDGSTCNHGRRVALACRHPLTFGNTHAHNSTIHKQTFGKLKTKAWYSLQKEQKKGRIFLTHALLQSAFWTSLSNKPLLPRSVLLPAPPPPRFCILSHCCTRASYIYMM